MKKDTTIKDTLCTIFTALQKAYGVEEATVTFKRLLDYVKTDTLKEMKAQFDL